MFKSLKTTNIDEYVEVKKLWDSVGGVPTQNNTENSYKNKNHP